MAWKDYYKTVEEQLAMLISGTTEAGVAIPGVPVTGGGGGAGGGLTDDELRAADVKVSLDSEAVVLGAGSAAVGKLAANSGVDIGDVDVKSIAAGEAVIGLVGTSDIVVTVTPTLDTNAYASGDLLFDSVEIPAAVRANGYTAILGSITILDKADQGVAMTLLLANAATDFGAANAAPDPDDTEAGTVIGWVPIATTDYVDLGASKVACIRQLGLVLKAGAATTSLYLAGINGTGTPTYAAGDLVIQLGFLRA